MLQPTVGIKKRERNVITLQKTTSKLQCVLHMYSVHKTTYRTTQTMLYMQTKLPVNATDTTE